ncbi:MAG: PCMD domain-containing protein [Bacteroidetes bacterium]|nr:PCMD domain-containing protein [Bacteroidota bacterium]
MKHFFLLFAFSSILLIPAMAQTPVPNGDFETWVTTGSYQNPQYWDSPNAAIAIALPFGTKVVTKSTDHESGSYSARIESKQLTFPSVVVPGALTLGTFTIDIFTQTFSLDGGVPINDVPTHLKGFFKYIPKGGDSCAIGIGLSKWNGISRDSIGVGAFSTHDTVNVWTPFSAWIDYLETVTPDTFNIVAISSADSLPAPGTVLFIDNLYLDYTVGVNENDPAGGIDIYQDRETHEILVYFDFVRPEATTIRLFNMMGQTVASVPAESVQKGRKIIGYQGFSTGVYVLEILHGGKKYCRKFVFNN